MEFILNVAIKSIGQVWLSWQHNWPYLAVSVVIATLLKLYVKADKVSAFLNRYRGAGVIAATAAAVLTPLCSCGTTAVVLGMMAGSMPWAPIVAFMVSSPLTSPEGLVYSAGLFGWPFALAFYLASIFLGLAGGGVATIFESRGWLANQARFAQASPPPCACPATNQALVTPNQIFGLEAPDVSLGAAGASCGCTVATPAEPPARCGCSQAATTSPREEPGYSGGGGSSGPAQSSSQATRLPETLTTILKELYRSAEQLVIMFTSFAFVGYFLNGLIPPGWVTRVFGNGNIYSVPLASTLGLPFYINAEASLPLVRTLLDAGMSQGAALAFLIVGAGTSIGAIAGALTIARWRVVALVVGVLWVGAILWGYAFDLALMLNLF